MAKAKTATKNTEPLTPQIGVRLTPSIHSAVLAWRDRRQSECPWGYSLSDALRELVHIGLAKGDQ